LSTEVQAVLYSGIVKFGWSTGSYPFKQRRAGTMMTIQTHQKINRECFGTPVYLEEGSSRVELLAIKSMAVDEKGLVHGGYIFGLADYAAMIAVNHPNVVLGASEVKFLKPVRTGETVIATATAEARQGKKQMVSVTVARKEEIVFSGSFTCFVLDRHVLA
jgi:uncharacterized protein (TIGR00369 family)